MQGLQQGQHARVGHPVQAAASIGTAHHQALAAQQAQLLGQTGLAQAYPCFQLPHRAFALAELTQQQQAVLVGKGAETMGLRKDDPQGAVDAITGVTITSRAIAGAVKEILEGGKGLVAAKE